MVSRSSHLASAFAAMVLLGCSGIPSRSEDQPSENMRASRAAIVVGQDDRKQLYEAGPALHDAARGSAVAIFYKQHLGLSRAPTAQIRALTASAALGLCPEARFSSEPSAALCSGVLIDDDLVATAGHCLGETIDDGELACKQLRLAFGYWYDGAQAPLSVAAGDVFECKRVVLLERDAGDFAVVQLDRPVTAPRKPAPLATRAPSFTTELGAASYGAGLPLKLQDAVHVLDLLDDGPSFVSDVDSFSGSSGGPLFDESGQVFGLVTQGEADWAWGTGCALPKMTEQSDEHAQRVDQLLSALCTSGWPTTVCGKGPSCGDGACNSHETHESCASDCAQVACGDGLCAVSERGECTADCNAFDEVPSTWPLSPEAYLRSHAPREYSASGGCRLAGEPGSQPRLAPLVALALLWLGRARKRGRERVPQSSF